LKLYLLKTKEGWAMKRVLALLAGVSLLSFSTVYAKGPHGGGPAGPKPYQGAGVGKEVSGEAKREAKQEGQGFGQTVREEAQNKTRLMEHKELKEQKKEQKREQKRIHKQPGQGNATTQ
jgi:hypothetical protein